MGREMQATAPMGEGDSIMTIDTQATSPGSQEPAEPQEPVQEPTEPQKIAEPPKVEAPVSQPTNQPETRKPSGFYKDRDRYKRRVDFLESTVKRLEQDLASTRQPTISVPAKPKEDPITDDKFFDLGPAKTLAELKQSLREELRQEILKEVSEKTVPELIK